MAILDERSGDPDMINAVWADFVKDEGLSAQQEQQFKDYRTVLLERRMEKNLTALSDPDEIVWYHFQDSLHVRDMVDVQAMRGIADIGSGAGFPGIPLKIMFPDVPLVLIEVLQKRVSFLQEVVDLLGLRDVHISTYDWRTFLRKTEYDIDLFMARASLAPNELLRMFRPQCYYRQARLIYFSSQAWKPSQQEVPYVAQEMPYRVGERERRLILFQSTAK